MRQIRGGLSLVIVGVVLGLIGKPDAAIAQATDTEQVSIDRSWIGINGHYRAGHWTAIRTDAIPSELLSSNKLNGGGLTLETTDGDGVIVKYQQFLDRPSIGYCVPGTEAAPLVVRSGPIKEVGEQGQASDDSRVLLRTRFPEAGVPAEGESMIPLGMPWVVVFGNSLGIDTIGANELLDRDSSVAVTKITDPQSIPDNVLGFSGVDLIVITSEGVSALSGLSPAQSKAISSWTRAGGRIFVTLGASAKQIFKAAPWLVESLPQSVANADVVRLDPSGIETFTSSQTRLSTFDGLRLPKITSLTGGRSSQIGETLVAGRTARRISAPVASRYVAGLGKITVIAADLDQSPFRDWPERFDLVTKLNERQLLADRGDASSSIRLSGYSDLSGQLRRSLDQFSIKRGLNFSLIALVIASLIILVAPLDYFVVRRFFGNPLLGWATFPIVVILLSVGLVFAAQPQAMSPKELVSEQSGLSKGTANSNAAKTMRSNSIELLDLDTETNAGRLFQWSFVYSHTAQRLSLQTKLSDALKQVCETVQYQTLRPFGAPDVAMGGIQIDGWSDAIEVPVSSVNEEDGITSRIESLEIAPRGSKSLALSMQFQSKLEVPTVKRRGGSELLRGQLTNPLEVDVLDAMLIYQNWVYLLPTRFPAGAVVEDIDRLRQKNFRWQLSRQRALESSSEGESWDVTRVDQPNRLAEMVMFHDAVGGSRYTGLRHEVLGDLDLSDLLTEDRCLLVGRCRKPWTELIATQAGDDEVSSPQSMAGDTSTWVRVLMPVEEVRR